MSASPAPWPRLREACELHIRQGGEGALAVEVFRALRTMHAECGWPPDTSIRRWLGGSWYDALRRARLETVPDGDVVASAQGGAFTEDEAAQAAADCAADLGFVPSFNEFKAWVRRPDVLARPGRRPMPQGVFDRLWPGQGWLGGLRHAGLINDSAEIPSAVLPLRPSAYRFSDEQIVAALRQCPKEVDRSPRSSEYIAWRAAQLRDDPTRALPSYNVLLRWSGACWDDALVAAGLSPLGGRATRSRPATRRAMPAPRFPESVLREVLAEAFAAVGDPFTSDAYRRWRREQIARDRVERRLRTLPSYDVFWKKYGSWAGAKRRLLGGEGAA